MSFPYLQPTLYIFTHVIRSSSSDGAATHVQFCLITIPLKVEFRVMVESVVAGLKYTCFGWSLEHWMSDLMIDGEDCLYFNLLLFSFVDHRSQSLMGKVQTMSMLDTR